MDKDLRQQLLALADKYETVSFLNGDPAWFMHQMADSLDQETAAFLAMSLSYGARQHFLPKIRSLMEMAQWKPYKWIESGEFEQVIAPVSKCFYRLYTYADIRSMLAALQELLRRYGSLGGFARTIVSLDIEGKTDVEAVLEAFSSFFRERGIKGMVPSPYTSACKRPCMFLRWMVRDNSPVDLGLWSSFMDQSHLFIPLDTHVMQTATRLHINIGKSAGWKAVVKLTSKMREVFPNDPARADYALYGYDIDSEEDKGEWVSGGRPCRG